MFLHVFDDEVLVEEVDIESQTRHVQSVLVLVFKDRYCRLSYDTVSLIFISFLIYKSSPFMLTDISLVFRSIDVSRV